MRLHWVIPAGILGGCILSIPHLEFFDPKQALPYRRELFMAWFATFTLVPFGVGFLAGRDCGGSSTRRALAGGVAGLLAVAVATGLLYILESTIPPARVDRWYVEVAWWFFNITFSVVGGVCSLAFKSSPYVR